MKKKNWDRFSLGSFHFMPLVLISSEVCLYIILPNWKSRTHHSTWSTRYSWSTRYCWLWEPDWLHSWKVARGVHICSSSHTKHEAKLLSVPLPPRIHVTASVTVHSLWYPKTLLDGVNNCIVTDSQRIKYIKNYRTMSHHRKCEPTLLPMSPNNRNSWLQDGEATNHIIKSQYSQIPNNTMIVVLTMWVLRTFV